MHHRLQTRIRTKPYTLFRNVVDGMTGLVNLNTNVSCLHRNLFKIKIKYENILRFLKRFINFDC